MSPTADAPETYFILFYDVVDGYAEKRARYRKEHLSLATEWRERGHLMMAGALADPIDGAVLVFRTPERSLVETFARSDPYVSNGLVTEWRIRQWTVVV